VSYKQTLILAGVLILLAGYLFFFRNTGPGEQKKAGPKIWSVDDDDIRRISIELPRENKRVSFFEDKDETWRFDDETRYPVDIGRWGGIALLVSGYPAKRKIAEKAEDLGEYGLAKPQMVLTLSVRGLKDPLEILFGDRTPNQEQVYAKMRQGDTVYMVHHSFCDVLRRLVLEPPLPPLIKARISRETKEKAKD